MALTDYIGHAGLDCTVFLSVLCLLYVTSSWVIPSCLLLLGIILICRLFQRWLESERVNGKGKYVLITGCDTGIGFALAKLLDRKGFHVYATCLSDSSDGAKDLKRSCTSRMRVLQLDVTSDDSVSACLQQVQSDCSDVGLWTLVNNAGTSLSGDVELQPMTNFKYYAELNLFGVVRICKAFLPLVRKRKGRVVNVSSVLGRLAYCTTSAYCMSKFGVEGFSDSLRLEMKRFGVKVIIVEPGNYGLNVGQYSEKNRQIMKSSYQKMADSVNEEVRSAYGDAYIQTFVNNLPRAHPFSEDKLRGVLEALDSAVASVHPRIRYLADSSNVWVDGFCIVARLRDILPEYWIDRIILWMRPLPKEANYAINRK